MVKHLLESLQNAHIPMKSESQRTISRFSRLMTTINKLEDRMDSFKNEMSLFVRIGEIINPASSSSVPMSNQECFPERTKDDFSETNDVFLSEDEKEKEERNDKNISGLYGNEAKKVVMGNKMRNFVEIYETMKEKKKEHVEFLGNKITEIVKEMSGFKELDNPRLLYLLRKVQKLKKILISLLPDGNHI